MVELATRRDTFLGAIHANFIGCPDIHRGSTLMCHLLHLAMSNEAYCNYKIVLSHARGSSAAISQHKIGNELSQRCLCYGAPVSYI